MTATIPQLVNLLNAAGSDVTFHRESGATPCPCRTPEGFRDPQWHADHPTDPICNEEGYLTVNSVTHLVKAAVQPATGGQRQRISERMNALLGDVQEDDHFGIFPCVWGGYTLDFTGWGEAGEDYIIYDDRRFVVIAADKIPDIDGDPNHHWEVGLRYVKSGRPNA